MQQAVLYAVDEGGAARCGAVRRGAVRCDAVRCGEKKKTGSRERGLMVGSNLCKIQGIFVYPVSYTDTTCIIQIVTIYT